MLPYRTYIMPLMVYFICAIMVFSCFVRGERNEITCWVLKPLGGYEFVRIVPFARPKLCSFQVHVALPTIGKVSLSLLLNNPQPDKQESLMNPLKVQLSPQAKRQLVCDHSIASVIMCICSVLRPLHYDDHLWPRIPQMCLFALHELFLELLRQLN